MTHFLELFKAHNKDFKVKFISILKDTSLLNVKDLSTLFDSLLESKKVTILFKDLDLDHLNNIVDSIAELEISIGNCSFHEEYDPNLS
jgi:hypothetical protein